MLTMRPIVLLVAVFLFLSESRYSFSKQKGGADPALIIGGVLVLLGVSGGLFWYFTRDTSPSPSENKKDNDEGDSHKGDSHKDDGGNGAPPSVSPTMGPSPSVSPPMGPSPSVSPPMGPSPSVSPPIGPSPSVSPPIGPSPSVSPDIGIQGSVSPSSLGGASVS